MVNKNNNLKLKFKMKKLIYLLTSATLFSCAGFLDTVPADQLSPVTFWKTEKDVNDAATACYNGWVSGYSVLYWDCTSDIAFNYHVHEGYRVIGDGSLVPSNTGTGFYDYTSIRRCNTFLEMAKDVKFTSETAKKDLFAQVRAIRAFKYAQMNWWYGGVPIIGDYTTAAEAQIPRSSEVDVTKFVNAELDAAIADLSVNASQSGRIDKGTALAIKMRYALYWGDYQRALDAANAIKALGKYQLHNDYGQLFTLNGKSSKEIIYAAPYVMNTFSFWLTGAMYNNGDGGWSSIVPTQNLVDMYEMSSGLTKEEAGSGYDAVYPFAGRDPRMAMSILYPGMDWKGTSQERIINTLDKLVDGKTNDDYPVISNNASKTALTWAKYIAPASQYSDVWKTACSPIVARYAEVLLTIAEVKIELNQLDNDMYSALDAIRLRAGMPAVDRAKYNSQATLRELLRRERCVELAGEGLRRADIVRWKKDGKLLAETVLVGPLTRVIGTIVASDDPFKRAKITAPTAANLNERLIEDRAFKAFQRYLPISQEEMDKNPNLTQTPGY